MPFFINSVAPPFTPVHRVRALGEAVGGYLSGLDKRVLLIGSGGLSHEPPVPTLETAPPHVVEGLIAGRHPSRRRPRSGGPTSSMPRSGSAAARAT